MSERIAPASDEAGLRGSLGDVSLVEVIQLLNFGRRSGSIDVEPVAEQGYPQPRGLVVVDGGQVRFAKAGGLFGEDALFALLSATRGRFAVRFERSVVDVPNVTHETTFLLLEHLRRHDEAHASDAPTTAASTGSWLTARPAGLPPTAESPLTPLLAPPLPTSPPAPAQPNVDDDGAFDPALAAPVVRPAMTPLAPALAAPPAFAPPAFAPLAAPVAGEPLAPPMETLTAPLTAAAAAALTAREERPLPPPVPKRVRKEQPPRPEDDAPPPSSSGRFSRFFDEHSQSKLQPPPSKAATSSTPTPTKTTPATSTTPKAPPPPPVDDDEEDLPAATERFSSLAITLSNTQQQGFDRDTDIVDRALISV